MDIQGRIKEIFDTKEYGKNGFQKRQMVVTTEEQYPQHLLIDFIQDKTSMLDNYQKGQLAKVSINLRGREWVSPQGETKYFNSLNGWRIQVVESQQDGGNTPPPPPEDNFEPVPDKDLNEDEHDDLPF